MSEKGGYQKVRQPKTKVFYNFDFKNQDGLSSTSFNALFVENTIQINYGKVL